MEAHKNRKSALALPCLIAFVEAGSASSRPKAGAAHVGAAHVGALPLVDFLGKTAPTGDLDWRGLCHREARHAWGALILARIFPILGQRASVQWIPIGQLWAPALVVRWAGTEARAGQTLQRCFMAAPSAWRAPQGAAADELLSLALSQGPWPRFEDASKRLGLFDVLRSRCASRSLRDEIGKSPLPFADRPRL